MHVPWLCGPKYTFSGSVAQSHVSWLCGSNCAFPGSVAQIPVFWLCGPNHTFITLSIEASYYILIYVEASMNIVTHFLHRSAQQVRHPCIYFQFLAIRLHLNMDSRHSTLSTWYLPYYILPHRCVQLVRHPSIFFLVFLLR